MIIMSPVSISTFYSFTFLPSVMHRIESLLTAAKLKSIPMGQCMQNVVISAIKVCFLLLLVLFFRQKCSCYKQFVTVY